MNYFCINIPQIVQIVSKAMTENERHILKIFFSSSSSFQFERQTKQENSISRDIHFLSFKTTSTKGYNIKSLKDEGGLGFCSCLCLLFLTTNLPIILLSDTVTRCRNKKMQFFSPKFAEKVAKAVFRRGWGFSK